MRTNAMRLHQALADRFFAMAMDAKTRIFLLLILLVIGLDALSKAAIIAHFPLGKYEFLFDKLLLIGHVQHIADPPIALLAAVCVYLAIVCLFRVPARVPLLLHPMALILGGALANTIEVTASGSATNWISILPEWRQTIGNFADLALSVGIPWCVINYCRMLLANRRHIRRRPRGLRYDDCNPTDDVTKEPRNHAEGKS